jgi:hypothetical protein
MILLIDNYDSFSYNLYQLVGTINPDIRVIRNDEMTVQEIEKLAPTHIILSPGEYVRRLPHISRAKFRCLECALDISQYAKPTVELWAMQNALCMVRCRRSISTIHH